MPTNDGEKSVPPLFVLYEHSSSVLCCGFYPSRSYQREQSSWLLSGDVDGTVVLWNLITRRSLISFSALEEAHRQLLDSAEQDESIGKGGQRACGATTEPGATLNLKLAALGPHCRSVIAVGFIPTAVDCATLPKGIGATCNGDGLPARQEAWQHSEKVAECDLTCSTSAFALYPPKSSFEGPQRQRLRLTRRTSSRMSATADSSPTADATSKHTSLQNSATSSRHICFYTHCRDQRVYIWSFSLPTISSVSGTPSLRLLAALIAPQHGFCPVENVSTITDGLSKTYLAVPHDSQGEITIWKLEWRKRHEDTSFGVEVHEQTVADAADKACGTLAADKRDADDDDVEEVDTTGMNPMDALIARAAAQERREERRRMRRQKSVPNDQSAAESDAQEDQRTSRLIRTPGAVVSKAERESFLCYVAPFATTAACGFSIRRLCSFSAIQRFKGGTIMRITMCADAQHLTVAFESGHVVLARFRTAPEKHYAAQTEPGVSGDQPSECSAGLERGRVSPSCVGVRCAVRAFAESALACWWSGHRVLACSAEGELHCYEAALAPQYSVSDVRPCVTDGPLKLQLLWSATLRKGIGSVCLQANLVVAGCWDSTLRLYDARDGRLLSILSYQRETINEVRMAPAAIARVAAFGFDVRQPRCYAPPPVRLMLTSIQDDSGGASCTADCGHNESSSTASLSSAHYNQNALAQAPDAREEELVYLFASASKDGTVALWRVDMQLVAEKAALKIMPA